MDTGCLYQTTTRTNGVQEGLNEVGSFGLRKNKQREDLIDFIAVFIYLQGGYKEWTQTRSRVPNDRMRGGGHKFQHRKFLLDVRENIFTLVRQ